MGGAGGSIFALYVSRANADQQRFTDRARPDGRDAWTANGGPGVPVPHMRYSPVAMVDGPIVVCIGWAAILQQDSCFSPDSDFRPAAMRW